MGIVVIGDVFIDIKGFSTSPYTYPMQIVDFHIILET